MKVNLVNLIQKPYETTYYVHGTENNRDVLKRVQKGEPTFIIQGSHDKLPGGFADFNLHQKVKRKRMPRYNKIRRKKLKSMK